MQSFFFVFSDQNQHMVAQIPKNAVIKFTASWCGPCKAIAPLVEKLIEELKLTLIVVDVDEDEVTSQKFKITAMPTIVFVKDDKELEEFRVIGANRATIETNLTTFASMLKTEKNPNQIDLPMSVDADVKKNAHHGSRT